MIVFDEVERIVMEQHGSLLTRHPGSAGACRVYTNSGGEGVWLSAGIYTFVASTTRLVLEALYLERFNACIVRVFTEIPLRFFYERKATTPQACAARVSEALGAFQMQLPNDLLSLIEHDASEGWHRRIFEALAPIPPPVNVANISE